MVYETQEEQIDKDLKISKYNSAGLDALRMSNLWQDAERHCRAGQYDRWNTDLDCLWVQLAGDVKDEDNEMKVYNSFCKALGGAGDLSPVSANGFEKPEQTKVNDKARQYGILIQKAIWLKRLQNKQGKGTAYYDEEDSFFD